MRPFLIAATFCCGCSGNRDADIDALKKQTSGIEAMLAAERAERTEWERKVTVALVGLKDSGIADMRWWCWQADCARSEDACRATIKDALASALNTGDGKLAGRVSATAVCVQALIAYCDDVGCFQDLDICQRVSAKPKLCRGVK